MHVISSRDFNEILHQSTGFTSFTRGVHGYIGIPPFTLRMHLKLFDLDSLKFLEEQTLEETLEETQKRKKRRSS